ncbi:MAG TPA: IDEAL domain-containing protein [Bacillus sp. (in: firmicutes)]|nr:IDEAL domain-containing protein [Bacillus sp. (in: firmicutes)]
MEKYLLKAGDWVKGKSREGELIHGYVEMIDSRQGAVKVNIVECDNEDMIGTTIWLLNNRVEKLPDVRTGSEEQILNLIDVALSTKDKQWFMELSEKLKSLRKTSEAGIKRTIIPPMGRKGIESSDTRG